VYLVQGRHLVMPNGTDGAPEMPHTKDFGKTEFSGSRAKAILAAVKLINA